MKIIGERIRKHRKIKGFTQEQLAEKSDLSTMSIRRYESGERVPPQDTLLKIAKALDIHLRDLLDSSIWEDFDKKHSDEIKNTVKYLEFIDFLKSSGYSYDYQVTKWHYGEVIDEPDIREKIVDESETTLSKAGHKATFTEKEFEDLQAGAKEAIEGKFYKKVLEQQKK